MQDFQQNLTGHTYHINSKRKSRLLHVGYLPNQGKGDPKPQIKLAGDWLATLGFLTGKTINLEASAGRLIITLQENESDQFLLPCCIESPKCNVELLRFGRIIQHPMLPLP